MNFQIFRYSAPFSQNGMKASQVDDPYASLINLNTAEPYGILNPSKPTLHNPADDLALIPNIQNTSLDNLHVSLEMIRPSKKIFLFATLSYAVATLSFSKLFSDDTSMQILVIPEQFSQSEAPYPPKN